MNSTKGKVTDLEKKVADLEKKLADTQKTLSEKEKLLITAKESYIRQLAETENVRQRGQRELADSRKFAVQSFSKALLDVVDTLTLAVSSLEHDESRSRWDDSMKNLFDGVQMTEKMMLKVFEENGVKRVRFRFTTC